MKFAHDIIIRPIITEAAMDLLPKKTYVFEVGLAKGRYSYATAVGLIQSVVSLVLIFTSNIVSKKISGTGLF